MSKTETLDPQHIVRVVDVETNKNLATYGREDMAQADYVNLTANDVFRQVLIEGKNDAVAADAIPLVGSFIPNFAGWYIEADDFEKFNADDWTVTQAGAVGTADVLAGGIGGILSVDSGGTGASDIGVQVQHQNVTILPAAGTQIRFGCRLKIADTIATCQFFAGLSVLDTTIIAAGAISATDYIGFLIDAADAAASAIGLELNSAAGSEEKSAAVHTAVEDTYVTLEFVLDGLTTVTPYVNGVAGTAITITSCPIVGLAASFVCQTEGANDPIVSVDWYYCAQSRA